MLLDSENFKRSNDGTYPDNAQAIRMFIQVITQWRVGPGGVVGLDYNIPFKLMDRMQLSGEEWDGLFSDLQVMERAAVSAMRRK